MKRSNIYKGLGFLAATAAGLTATPAAAMEVATGGGWSVRLDSELSTGFQVRAEDRDCRIISLDNGGCAETAGRINSLIDPATGAPYNPFAVPDFNFMQVDSGNLNYDKGDIVSWTVKGTHDLAVKGPDDWGGLVRVNWASDFLAEENANFPLPGRAQDSLDFDVTLLDAWVSKGFNVGNQTALVRVGNQVVSWGEDIFIPGGINAINAIDLRKWHTPGTALKEIFVPAPMVYINTGVTDDLSAEGYYQWGWNSFKFDPVGTYFSAVDILGPGQLPAFVPSSVIAAPPFTVGDEHALLINQIPTPRGTDREPDDQGQFGLTLRYQLGDAELGAHYVRYHDKLPFISFTMAGGIPVAYNADYGQDRDLFGVSGNMPVSTAFGDIVFGAELSYRPKDSVAIDPTIQAATSPYFVNNGYARGFTEERKWQAHLTANHLFSPDSPIGQFQERIGGTDGWVLAELAFVNYPGLDRSGATPYLLNDYSMPDEFSMGYVVEIGTTFPHIMGTAVNFTPYIDFLHDVHGTSPNALPFVEDRKSLALNLGFNYKGFIRANVVYGAYWGGGANNTLQDRDFVGASVTYSF